MRDKRGRHRSRREFPEAKVMLWLLASDLTNPRSKTSCLRENASHFDAAYARLREKSQETGEAARGIREYRAAAHSRARLWNRCGVLIDKSRARGAREEYRAGTGNDREAHLRSRGEVNSTSILRSSSAIYFSTNSASRSPRGKRRPQAASARHEGVGAREDPRPPSRSSKTSSSTASYRSSLDLYRQHPTLLDEEDSAPYLIYPDGRGHRPHGIAEPEPPEHPDTDRTWRAIRDAFVAPRALARRARLFADRAPDRGVPLGRREDSATSLAHGRDVHTRGRGAACFMRQMRKRSTHEMRRRAKVINFGILYGMGANALKHNSGQRSPKRISSYDDYFATSRRLRSTSNAQGFARKHGYTETLFGRRRAFPEMKSPLPYVRAQAERMAMNAPIQGTQADISSSRWYASMRCLRKKRKGRRAHDTPGPRRTRVRSEKRGVKELAPVIESIMESVLTSEQTNGVPIIAQAKSGAHWGDMKPL